MKKLLLITDQPSNSNESSIRGYFNEKTLEEIDCQFSVNQVFFERSQKQAEKKERDIILPQSAKHRNLVSLLETTAPINQYDFIIVRNFFNVLKQIQKSQPKAKIGFWESFPHSYRRLEQAIAEKRSVLRKRLEYSMKKRKEKKLISRCDFYLPITDTYKEVYYPSLSTPYFATPMGFDFHAAPDLPKKECQNGPVRFIYIGAIDSLRQVDKIHDIFLNHPGDFELIYYSSSKNQVVDYIKSNLDPRMSFHGGISRTELIEQMMQADIGVCFTPPIKTYTVASPTKTVEYAVMGLPILGNHLRDYDEYLTEDNAFLCNMDSKSIHAKISQILALSKNDIEKKGQNLQKETIKYRSYTALSKGLFSFLNSF